MDILRPPSTEGPKRLLAVASTATPAPGWRLAVVSLLLSIVAAGLISGAAVTAGWLATRLAFGGVVVLALGLAFGSTSLVGLATLPVLTGATIGLDRPEGHAWGQTLLIGLVWYVTAEVGWSSIEARDPTVRSPAVDQLRVREVSTVVVVAVLVGVGAAGLAAVAPTRTVLVRALTIAVVLACVVGLGRVLTRRIEPEPEPGGGQPTAERR